MSLYMTFREVVKIHTSLLTFHDFRRDFDSFGPFLIIATFKKIIMVPLNYADSDEL